MEHIFGRIEENGNVIVLYVEDGDIVTTLDEDIYSVGSEFSARYEHPNGIVLFMEDAEKIGLDIEK